MSDQQRYLIETLKQMQAEQRLAPRTRWAVVASLSPLRVRLEEDDLPLLGTPSTLVHPSLLSVGQRVEVLLQNQKVTIQGMAGGGDLHAASQAEVNAGVNNTKYVSPKTLAEKPIIAFMARLTNDWVHTGSTQTTLLMPFDFMLVNSGDHYNPTTRTFTAPLDGVYNFSAQFLTSNATAGPVQSLRKNGVVYRDNISMGYGQSYSTFGFDVLINLVAGDTIMLYNTNANITNNTFTAARSNHYCGKYLGKHTA